jgi:WD40 repeat protein
MSTIFISHSSKDNDRAEELRRRLSDWKYHSFFLDYDREQGIPGGSEWHRAIYRAMSRSEAVIFLCSPESLESYWCFAELAEARSTNKYLFPLLLAPLPRVPDERQLPTLQILKPLQTIDLNAADGYERLRRGLEQAGLEDGFAWDPKRPPYPGMTAFAEEDAGTYFGREDDISKLRKRLGKMQLQREPLLQVLFGSSGCGKSSLMRAGIVPRLRRDRSRWLVVPAFRPRQQPRNELARALAAAFETAGVTGTDWNRIREDIGDAVGEQAATALVRLANDLRMKAQQKDASVLLVIDQLEELFTEESEPEAGQFLTLLRGALGSSDSPLLAVATMRSEFFSRLQARPELSGFSFSPYSVEPMTTTGFRSTITEPARIAGIDIEPSLVDHMLDDMKNADALPLLAFVLGQLYERSLKSSKSTERDDLKFTEFDYGELGGIKGIVEKRVEEALADCQTTLDRSAPALRVAFVDRLGGFDEDGRQFTRRPARWSEISKAAEPILRRLCEERLLVSSKNENDEGVLEVAHEALFREWSTLALWIDADREFLLWRKRFDAAYKDWVGSNYHRTLLLRGPMLDRARRNLRDRPDRFEKPEAAFVRASRWWGVEKVAAAASIVLAISTALFLFYHLQTKADQLIKNAADERKDDPSASVAMATQDINSYGWLRSRAWGDDAWNVLRQSLIETHARAVLRFGDRTDAPEWVSVTAFAPNGKLVVTAGTTKTARLWRLREGGVVADKIADLPVTPSVQNASFSADGQRLLIADSDQVGVYNITASGAPMVDHRPTGPVVDLCQGWRVASTDGSGIVHVWNVVDGTERALRGSSKPVNHLLFDRDCSHLAIEDTDGLRVSNVDGDASVQMNADAETGPVDHLHFSSDGQSLLAERLKYDRSELLRWDAASGKPLGPLRSNSGEIITDAAYSADGKHVAAVSAQGGLYVWVAETGERLTDSDPLGTELRSVVFSPGGTWIATGGQDPNVRLWSWSAGRAEPVATLRGHTQPVQSVRFSPDGRFVLSGSGDDSARVWEVGTDEDVLRTLPEHEVSAQAVSPLAGETLIATGGVHGGIRLWGLDTPPRELHADDAKGAVKAIAFSSNGNFLVSASEDGNARLWQRDQDLEQTTPWRPFGEPLTHGGTPVDSATVGDKGTLVVTAPNNDAPRLWTRDADGTWKSERLGTKTAHRVALSARDQWLAVLTDNEVLVGPPAVGGAFEPLSGHTDRVNAAAFSPDGSQIVTASDDGTARLWDVATRKSLVTFSHDHQRVNDVAFSPDGRLVITAAGRDVRIWNAGSSSPQVAKHASADVLAAAVDGCDRYLVAATTDRVMIYQWAAFAPPAALLGEIKRIGIGEAQPMSWRTWLW